MTATKRTLTETQMIAILKDFDRKPVRARHEVGTPDGSRVLIPEQRMGHYYARPVNKAVALGYLDHFSRCGCGGPCSCVTNGWHITDAGKAFLAAQVSS